MPLNRTGANLLIDGILADGSGYDRVGGVSARRLQEQYESKLTLLSQVRKRTHDMTWVDESFERAPHVKIHI